MGQEKTQDMHLAEQPDLPSLEAAIQQVEAVSMDSQEGVLRAVEALEEQGYIVVHFGSTWGIVFPPEQRPIVRAIRKESPDKPLAVASLFTTEAVVRQMRPQSISAAFFDETVDYMTNIGFMRFPFDVTAPAFAEGRISGRRGVDRKRYLESLQLYCVNQNGGVQVFPMYNHPLADAWAAIHPERPTLAVRSANQEGDQEQAGLDGAKALAYHLGLFEIYALSESRLREAERDDQVLFAAGLQKDARGFAVGAYHTYVLTGESDPNKIPTKKRWGSVPIVELLPETNREAIESGDWAVYPAEARRALLNPQSSLRPTYLVDRLGNTHPDAMVTLLGGRNKNIVVVNRKGDRDYRSKHELSSNELPWWEARNELIAAACLAAARNPELITLG